MKEIYLTKEKVYTRSYQRYLLDLNKLCLLVEILIWISGPSKNHVTWLAINKGWCCIYIYVSYISWIKFDTLFVDCCPILFRYRSYGETKYLLWMDESITCYPCNVRLLSPPTPVMMSRGWRHQISIQTLHGETARLNHDCSLMGLCDTALLHSR